ncbi:MAG: adenosylcobinamide-GDP ribazoletransferase [Burkholderiaceae bacterium]|nr:adenosylcobinamide-GDP ribazoletransferase [Burkholderiaceae bacterium]
MLHELRLFFTALQFFTRVPIPAWVGYEPLWLQDCARHYPLVGACVGTFGALVLWLALLVFPPSVAVGLSMAATIWMTGGFHEDGWADTCDALGGTVSRERALQIMKDSRIGAYGAIGLVLMLGLKAATLTALVQAQPLAALLRLVLAHAASRAAPVWLLHALPYAGDAEHAKAKPMAMQISGAGLGVALLWVLLIGLLCLWLQPQLMHALAAAAVAALLATVQMRRWLNQRLGGFTGDTLGATQQLVELVILLALLALLHG